MRRTGERREDKIISSASELLSQTEHNRHAKNATTHTMTFAAEFPKEHKHYLAVNDGKNIVY